MVELPLVIDIPRTQYGVIEGTVFNPDGSRAPFAQVVLGGGPTAPTTTAAADGTFGFSNVALGRFYLRATPQVGATQEASTSGELVFENDIARVSLILGGTATVTGTVVQADGITPAPFADVFLSGQPFAGCESAQPISCSAGPNGQPSAKCLARAARGGCLNAADATGRFTFSRISARTFSVVAEAADGRLGQVGGPLNPNQTLDLRVVLSASSRVVGRVLSSTGAPVALAVAEFSVTPLALGQPSTIYAQTAADGTFVFESIRTGGPFALSITDPLGDGIALRNVTSTGTDIDLGDIVLDEGAPSVLTTTPAPASVGVPLGSTFRITLSEPVDLATVTAANILLSGPTGTLTSVLTLESGDASVLLRPLSPLLESTRYTLQVRNLKDRFGKAMTMPFATTFTAIDLTAPTIVSLSPSAAASGVPVTSAIRVQFSEPVDPARFVGAPIVVTRGAETLTGRTDYLFGNTVIVFTPAFPLFDDTPYALRVAAASDAAGNAQAAPLQTTFSTTDRTAPQITAVTPANGGRVIEGTTIDVTATTATAFDVAFVDFYVNGVLTFTDRNAPFVLPFLAAPSIGGPGAQVGIGAVATDTSGNRGTQLVNTVVEILPDQAPTVVITSPADGFAAGNNQRITLNVSVTDDVGVTQVAYRAETGRPTDAATVALTPIVAASQQVVRLQHAVRRGPGFDRARHGVDPRQQGPVGDRAGGAHGARRGGADRGDHGHDERCPGHSRDACAGHRRGQRSWWREDLDVPRERCGHGQRVTDHRSGAQRRGDGVRDRRACGRHGRTGDHAVGHRGRRLEQLGKCGTARADCRRPAAADAHAAHVDWAARGRAGRAVGRHRRRQRRGRRVAHHTARRRSVHAQRREVVLACARIGNRAVHDQRARERDARCDARAHVERGRPVRQHERSRDAAPDGAHGERPDGRHGADACGRPRVGDRDELGRGRRRRAAADVHEPQRQRRRACRPGDDPRWPDDRDAATRWHQRWDDAGRRVRAGRAADDVHGDGARRRGARHRDRSERSRGRRERIDPGR